MSTLCHVFSQWESLRITADSEGAVWIRGGNITVSLNLDAADREKLRAALDSLDSPKPEQVAA